MHHDNLDERLWEWAAYFKDRKRLNSAGSIEGRFKPHSDDYASEGWGNPEKTPTPAPRPRDWVLRAVETHEAIQSLDIKYKWGLTYAFCYPGLSRHLVLRMMKKYTGKRFTWNTYLELVNIGRYRVQAVLNAGHHESCATNSGMLVS